MARERSAGGNRRWKGRLCACIALLALVAGVAPAAAPPADEATGTFSIIARDPATGELGLGVQSKAFAVGSRVITIKGGVAVVAHQAASNPMYGVIVLDMLLAGMNPQQALDVAVRADDGRDRRQVAVLDIQGRTAAWTGSGANDWKGHRCGENYCVQGNILEGAAVVDAMASSFESSSGPLAERLLAALDAAKAAGGDRRGMQSAALVVARPLGGAAGFSDRVVDLRVDDHRTPLVEMRRLLGTLRSDQLVSDAREALVRDRLPDALEKTEEAIERAPHNDNAWVMYARLQVRAGRRAEAIAAVRRAVDANPANKRLFASDPAFESLRDDPAFRAAVR